MAVLESLAIATGKPLREVPPRPDEEAPRAQLEYRLFVPDAYRGYPVCMSARWQAAVALMDTIGLFVAMYPAPSATHPITLELHGTNLTDPADAMDLVMERFPLWELTHGPRALPMVNALLPLYGEALRAGLDGASMARVHEAYGRLDAQLATALEECRGRSYVPDEAIRAAQEIASGGEDDRLREVVAALREAEEEGARDGDLFLLDGDAAPDAGAEVLVGDVEDGGSDADADGGGEDPEAAWVYLEGRDMSYADFVLGAHAARFRALAHALGPHQGRAARVPARFPRLRGYLNRMTNAPSIRYYQPPDAMLHAALHGTGAPP